jgi:hypothetical protein
MATALVYAASSLTRNRLNEQLSAAHYTVECVEQLDAVAAILRHEARDVIISEARKDNFAYLMRLAFVHNSNTILHFFEERSIFCFYPLQKQPAKLVDAILQSGLLLSSRLLQHTEKTHDGDGVDNLTVELL